MPFCYFPIFYTVREAVYHPAPLEELAQQVRSKYHDNMWDDLTAASSVMVPQDALLVFLIPTHLAVPFVSVTGMVWVVVLSSTRGSERGN